MTLFIGSAFTTVVGGELLKTLAITIFFFLLVLIWLLPDQATAEAPIILTEKQVRVRNARLRRLRSIHTSAQNSAPMRDLVNGGASLHP